MKHPWIVFAAALALGTAQAQESGAAREAQRDANQQQRIEQGLQSGALSTREAGQLERQEQRIEHQGRAISSTAR
jgi:hypothetical protein